MKKLLLITTLGFALHAQSQCTVDILAQSDTLFCNGDSVVLIASAGDPAAALDQSALVYNSGTSARNLPGYSIWQSFTAGASGTLTQIDLGFFNFINGSGTLSVYAGTGTAGTQLSTQTINVSCPSGNCLLYFAQNVPVTAGMVYTFEFIPGAGIPDPYGVQMDLPGSYPGGTFALVDPSGTYADWDMVFRTHVMPSLHYLWSNGETDSVIVADQHGLYYVTVTDSLGCTVADTVHITVYTVDTSVTALGELLVAQSTDGTYQWIDCGSGLPIPGENGQSFTATTNGSYAVIVTENGCSDTSSCYLILSTGVDGNNVRPLVIVPNPSTGKFTIANVSEGTIEIVNVLGETVYSGSLAVKNEIDLSNEANGIYFAKVTSNGKVYSQRVVLH